VRDPSSPGTSSLVDSPSPDGLVNVHSRRTEILHRPTAATPPVSLRPRGFSPPRRFPPFTTSGMLQPVPGLGSPGFRRIGRRSRSFSGRVLLSHWRSTLRRFAPRRQPYRITAACSPPAVPLPARVRRLGGARAARSIVAGSVVSDVPANFPKPSSVRLSAMGVLLRCAVRPTASGLPLSRSRRAPGPCRIAGRPAVVHRTRLTSQ